MDLLVSEIGIYSSEFNQSFVFENRYKITNISTNYHISAIISGFADGCHPALSFDILEVMFLQNFYFRLNSPVNSPSRVSAHIPLHGATALNAYYSIVTQWNNRHSEQWIREGECTEKTKETARNHRLRLSLSQRGQSSGDFVNDVNQSHF